MTVAQLIEKLKGYHPDMMVLVDGYEGGFCRIESIGTVVVVNYPVPYEGEFSGCSYNMDQGPNFEALVLSRPVQ